VISELRRTVRDASGPPIQSQDSVPCQLDDSTWRAMTCTYSQEHGCGRLASQKLVAARLTQRQAVVDHRCWCILSHAPGCNLHTDCRVQSTAGHPDRLCSKLPHRGMTIRSASTALAERHAPLHQWSVGPGPVTRPPRHATRAPGGSELETRQWRRWQRRRCPAA
jgi:hypothetical protein